MCNFLLGEQRHSLTLNRRPPDLSVLLNPSKRGRAVNVKVNLAMRIDEPKFHDRALEGECEVGVIRCGTVVGKARKASHRYGHTQDNQHEKFLFQESPPVRREVGVRTRSGPVTTYLTGREICAFEVALPNFQRTKQPENILLKSTFSSGIALQRDSGS